MDQTEVVIRGIVDAAVNCISTGTASEATSVLLRAIDKAMTHAHGEGRADERGEWVELAMRRMNETGQGEHGVSHDQK